MRPTPRVNREPSNDSQPNAGHTGNIELEQKTTPAKHPNSSVACLKMMVCVRCDTHGVDFVVHSGLAAYDFLYVLLY